MNPSFDLVREPWIPCIERDGRRVELGIAETLRRAHELVELRDQSPLVTSALHRLLLAVLHRSLDGPRNLKALRELWSRGQWDMTKIGLYLERWHDRFDLFHSVYPFYQVGGFEIVGKESEDKTTPISKLAQELATGSNCTLFDHSTDDHPLPISPAEAARRLVAIQAFALGGGVGSTSRSFGKHPNLTHGPMVGGAAVFIRGGSLFETLCLNTLVVTDDLPFPRTPEDRPCWEDEVRFEPVERAPRGYLDFLTWLSRYVRLLPGRDESGRVIVSGMYFTQGCGYPKDPLRYPNPHWAYRSSKDKGLMPLGMRATRALWRDSSALFTAAGAGSAEAVRPHNIVQAARLFEDGHLERTHVLRCFVVGLASDKAKVDLWRHEDLPLHRKVLNDEDCARALSFGLEQSEDVQRNALSPALKHFVNELGGACQVVQTQAEATYWDSLELPFRVFLSGIPLGTEAALRSWAGEVRRAAIEAFHSAVDNAEGRRARELKASIRCERILLSGLRKLRLVEPQGGAA